MCILSCTTGSTQIVLPPSTDLSCQIALRKTIESLQAYRRLHNGSYPDRISSVKAAGLLKASDAMCPIVTEGSGGNPNTATSRGGSGDPPGSFEYELSREVEKWKSDSLYLPENTPTYTRQDLKAELLRRPFWQQIPLLRCSGHSHKDENGKTLSRLNGTADGSCYWSGLYWEQKWIDVVPYCARDANVFFGLKGPPFHSGRPPQHPDAVDLRDWTCAFGDVVWWWIYPIFDEGRNRQLAANLKPFFGEDHGRALTLNGETWWIDGLTQLQGYCLPADGVNIYRGPTMKCFVPKRTGAKIERLIKGARWLQGTAWPAPMGETVGWLTWHYSDGQTVQEPIVYGKNTGRFWNDGRDDDSGLTQPIWSTTEEVSIGGDPKRIRQLRLFRQEWMNPRANVAVQAVDFASNLESTAAPFLVSLSVIP